MTARAPWSPIGRRPVVWSGVVLVVAGLVLIGYVGWQYVGTNVVSDHRRHRVERDLRRAWGAGRPSAVTGWGRSAALVRIPRFGKEFRVPVLEGTGAASLGAGLGHYPRSAGPGEVGNFAVAGHRVTHGEPLRHLPDLRVGDRVVVETATTTYTYRLVSGGRSLVVPSSASWVTAPLPHNPVSGGVEPPQRRGQRLLTLTTCSELFHTADRMAVFGVLVATAPRASTTSP